MNKELKIVIIGAGISGVSAALSAAESGMEVVIIERSNNIGGNAIRSNVGTICGAYLRSFADEAVRVGNEFMQSFIIELQSHLEQEAPLKHQHGLYVIPYGYTELASFLENKLQQYKNITLLHSTEFTAMESHENRISTVKTNHPDFESINCHSVIDCSGKAVVSAHLGHELLRKKVYQASSQVFRVKNVNSEDSFSLAMAIKKQIIKSLKKHEWPQSYLSASIIPGSLKSGAVLIKLTLPQLISDDTNLIQLSEEAKLAVQEVFEELKGEVDSFRNAELDMIFPEVGVRVMNRPAGKIILKEQDLVNIQKHESGVAVGAWPMEYWNKDGILELTSFPEDEYYLIPAESLMSAEIENLFFAGKNISASDKAIASARVIGTCIQTGYAAGKLASTEDMTTAIIQLRKGLKIGDEYI